MLPPTVFQTDPHLRARPAPAPNPRNVAWAARLQRAFTGYRDIARTRSRCQRKAV